MLQQKSFIISVKELGIDNIFVTFMKITVGIPKS